MLAGNEMRKLKKKGQHRHLGQRKFKHSPKAQSESFSSDLSSLKRRVRSAVSFFLFQRWLEKESREPFPTIISFLTCNRGTLEMWGSFWQKPSSNLGADPWAERLIILRKLQPSLPLPPAVSRLTVFSQPLGQPQLDRRHKHQCLVPSRAQREP